MRSLLRCAAGAVCLAGLGCSIPSSLVVSNAQATYACSCTYNYCQAPTSGCGCAPGGATITGAVGTYLCESVPANIDADCQTTCAALSGQLGGTAGCGPIAVGAVAGTATLVAASSCNPGTAAAPVLGGGAVNSYVMSVGSGATLSVMDTATGSSAVTAAHGTLAYTVDGSGHVTMNLIALTFDAFSVDLTPVTNLTILGEAAATGTISGTSVNFPPSSLLVTISGDGVPPHQASQVFEVAEPANDGDVTGTFDPATNSFTLDGLFRSSDFVAGTAFTATVALQGTYVQAPPAAVAGGPYTAACGPVALDGSASTDGNGSTTGLTYQWFEGQTFLAPGAKANVNLAAGSHTLTLRVFDANGEFSEATTSATVTGSSSGPVIQQITNTLACLAPSNGLFVRYDLGSQIQVQVADACDPSPVVHVVSVVDDGVSGGSDVSVGSTAFCVRSLSAGPATRTYTVQLQATDSQGLTSPIATTTIEVPAEVEGEPTSPGAGQGDGSSAGGDPGNGGDDGSCGNSGSGHGRDDGDAGGGASTCGNGGDGRGGGVGDGDGQGDGDGHGNGGGDGHGGRGGDDGCGQDGGATSSSGGSGGGADAGVCVVLPLSDFIPPGDPRCVFAADAGVATPPDAGVPPVVAALDAGSTSQVGSGFRPTDHPGAGCSSAGGGALSWLALAAALAVWRRRRSDSLDG